MTNIVKCPNCETENHFYNLNCNKCGSLIRERVVNIDLWHTIGKIIEAPSKAFRNLIFAENKNYAFFIAIFFSIKLTFNSFYFQSLIGKNIDFQNFLGINILIGVILFLVFFLLISYFEKIILKVNNVQSRFKDNFTVLIYSSVPLLIALFIFFPVEYALFGKFWLFFNPSPYFIKPTPAYVFTGLEAIILVWNVILFYFLAYVQSRNILFSAIYSLVVITLIGLLSFTIPYL